MVFFPYPKSINVVTRMKTNKRIRAALNYRYNLATHIDRYYIRFQKKACSFKRLKNTLYRWIRCHIGGQLEIYETYRGNSSSSIY